MSEINRDNTAATDEIILNRLYPEVKVNLRFILYAVRDLLMERPIFMCKLMTYERSCNVIVPSLNHKVSLFLHAEYIAVHIKPRKMYKVPYTLDERGIVDEETMDLVYRLLMYLKVEKEIKSSPSSIPSGIYR
jgi:hypothetical protein